MTDISLKATKGIVTGDILTANGAISIGNITLNSDIGNISSADILPFSLEIDPEVLVINADAPFAGNDITWLFTWQQSTLPYARATITNQAQISVPLYKEGTYQVNNFANEIHGNMDQTHKLRLKWVDGAGLDNLVSWAVDAGNVTFSHPDINSGANTTVQRLNIAVPADITIPTLNLPSNVYYNVAATTSNVYSFSGLGVGDNRTIGPLYRGATYTFNLASSLGNDNKFYLTTDNGTGFVANSYVGEYTTGVTGSRGNGAAGYNTLTFTVPQNAPDTLFYQSANVAARHGAIIIKDLQVETNINGNYVLYFQHMKEGHKTPVEIKPIPSMVNQMCLVYDASVQQFVPQDMATYVDNTPSFKNKIREVAGTATLIAPNGVALVPTVLVVEDISYLPLVGNKDGDIAFDAYTNTMYVWGSNTWNSTKPNSVAGTNVTGTVSNANVANSVTSGTITLAQSGNITTPFTGVARFDPTANMTINNVFATLGTASSTNLGFMLKKNGANVGTYTVTANSYRMSGVSANVSVSTTDYLTLDVTSGTGATDLRVDLQYRLQ